MLAVVIAELAAMMLARSPDSSTDWLPALDCSVDIDKLAAVTLALTAPNIPDTLAIVLACVAMVVLMLPCTQV